MIEEYFINEDTLILVPNGKLKTKVYDKEGIFDIKMNILDIIENSCNYYGSSFLGRCIGSKKILNMNYKLPIIIDEVKETILIPTSSPKCEDCHWICLNNIEDYMGPKIEVTAGEIYSGTLSEKLYYYLAVNMEGFTNPEDEYLVGENGKDNDYGFVTVGPGLLMDDGKVKSYIEKGGTYTEGMNKEVGSLWDKDIILEMYIEYVDTTFATTVVEMLDGYEVSQKAGYDS